jgi:hypothetical protein
MMPDHQQERALADVYRRELDRVEADLVTIVRHHARTLGVPIVTTALVEVLGGVLADVVTANPAAAAGIADTLAQLQLYVATVNQAPQ